MAAKTVPLERRNVMTQKFSIRIALLLVVVGIAAVSIRLPAQDAGIKSHRVVFEVNVDGQEAWTGILNNVENLQKALGQDKVKIELVAHGKGLSLLLATDAEQKERLQRIAATGVVLSACENTMRRKNVKKEDLLPFTGTVPSGVTEVVLKQEAGWSYIKGGS